MKLHRYIDGMSLLFFALALMPGCSTSVLVNRWNDASYRGPALTDVLVVAIRKDPVRRRVWEDAFCEEFARHGVKAMQSYRLFPGAAPDSAQLAGAVATYAFDGIIITRRLPKTVNAQYVPRTVVTEPETKYSPRKQQFFTYYREVEQPGYVDTLKIANRSIDVWTTGADGGMIWSAVSETPEPATAAAVHRDVTGLAATDLQRLGIIAKAK